MNDESKKRKSRQEPAGTPVRSGSALHRVLELVAAEVAAALMSDQNNLRRVIKDPKIDDASQARESN